jgi:mono/diheme cytochrome c family protein
VNGAYLNTLTDGSDTPIVINGLWGLAFGNGASNQPTKVLYVTAGSNGGMNGLYARIDLGTTAPDIAAPSGVAISAPAAAATVSGTIAVAASASDNIGVTKVVFSVESGGTTSEIGTATAAPFGIDWNSGTVTNGPASLTARAFDAYGNSTTSAAVMVTVDNVADVGPPTVSISAPAPGNVSGLVTVSATASDDVGVASVQFFAGATSLGTDTTSPYSVVWDTTGLSGTQTLTAVATDGAGNMTTSAAVQVTVTANTVTLAQLQTEIFTPYCASCHNGTSTDTLAHPMNLSSANASYSSMVGIASDQVGLQRVQPFNAASSYLIRKLEGSQSSGSQMPTNGPYLDTATIDKVRSWIQAGALQ